ncbi:mobilome CxxCx(11)CxxC protein [Pseudomonas sp. ZB1P45]|uniref:mobilome CxxCx(11)CxxC protein n=1 Tax=Pseudomonas frigoris TaxID=3398356 RepID=UPI0039EE52EE
MSDFKEKCLNKELDSYGTSRVFKKRSDELFSKRNIITYLGLAVPALVGASVLAVGTGIYNYIVYPAGALVVAQLALSLWAIVAQWDSKYAYAVNAMQANLRICESWKRLGANPPGNFQAAFDDLADEDLRQAQIDLTQNIKDSEIRFGMRMSLYQYRIACVVCKVKPINMIPSKCHTCGNF